MMDMVLFVNGCVRKGSRTLRLAREVLRAQDGEPEEVTLYREGAPGLDEAALEERDRLVRAGQLEHPSLQRAVQFARADSIVIAAPYWDLLFPARVRAYLEEIMAAGITFRYDETGTVHPLCRAKKLTYVTTAGGMIQRNLGYEYVRALAETFLGVEQVELVSAQGLDIWGADAEKLLAEAAGEYLDRQAAGKLHQGFESAE